MLDHAHQTEDRNGPTERLIDVLLVDDHVLLSETLAAGLAASNGDMIVEFVRDVDTALERIKERGRYTVILLDYFLPGVEGLDALRRLDKANEGGVALFSGVAGWSVAERAIENGARGFIPKTITLKTLSNAIRFIADGELYLPADYMLQASQAGGRGFGLKPREIKVLSLLSEGHPNKEIGRQIGVAETIVKMDVKSICRKLGVNNRTQAVLAAQKNGLL